MKTILSLIISGALVVSGYSQTRNVLVGTNNAVVQPTNFWSADASNARSGLGLGSAATNPASAFQPSSTALSNLAAGNGGGLTNITATIVGTNISITNVVGLQSALDSKLATNGNTTGTASNVTGVVALANGGTGATNASSARTSLGATTLGGNIFTLANTDEIRFLRINANNSVSALTAEDFRTALSLGTNLGTVTSVGMTVPTIFSLSTSTVTSSGTFALTLSNQSSRHAFLAPNGGGIPAFRAIESDDLPALAIAKVTGLQTALDGKLSTGGTATLATNVTGIVALANGGTGANSAATARTSLGATTVGDNIFTLANPSAIRFLRLNADNTVTALSDSDFRSAIGLGTAATNPATAFQSSSSVLTNLAANNGASLTNLTAANIVGTVGLASNITGTASLATNVTGVVALANGGTAGTNAATARTSLGATTIGANLFTLANPDDTRFIRLNANNSVSSLTAADMRTALSVGTNLGTVTSVGLTVPAIFSLSTPTITSSGTFALTLANQTSRHAFLAPNGGGVPSFRAVESDDLPSLAISKITGLQTALDGKLSIAGTATLATNVTGVVSLANGGTGSTNASDARAALGLGTAATSATTAFQPAASALTNLAANNGGGLTNLQATSLVGIIPASNISTVTISNIGGTLPITQGGTGATNASGARTALELGTAATNPSTAFQAASSVLTNLAANNGSSLTNIPVVGVVGALSTNGSAAGLTNFPASLLTTNGNGSGLTNLSAANIVGTVALASNVTGTIAISNGGSGATTAGGARTNLGLGATNNVVFESVQAKEIKEASGTRAFDLENFALTFGTNYIVEWSTNEVQINSPLNFFGTNVASTSRTNLGLGGTNSAFSSLSVGQLITNQASASNASSAFGRQISVGSTVENSFAAGFGLSMSNFPSGGAGGSVVLGGLGTMTHWGAFLFNGVPQGGVAATSRGNSTFAVNASNGIYLNGPMYFEGVSSSGNGLLRIGSGGVVARAITNVSTGQVSFLVHDGNPDPSVAWTAFTPAQARTNLGLAWSALTNSNAGTELVSVNTNGDVVSPPNFWQVAPINTRVQVSQPVVNATNAATNARNLYLYSLAISTVGITNTITLPTNSLAFLGDVATVIHDGPTSSVTAVRQVGSATNLITLNQVREAVKFIYESNGWRLADNVSYIEPIQFSGTNAVANAAASRTNLELGLPALTNTSNTTFQQAIFITNTAPTNTANVNGIGFNTAVAWMSVSIVTNGATNSYRIPLFQ